MTLSRETRSITSIHVFGALAIGRLKQSWQTTNTNKIDAEMGSHNFAQVTKTNLIKNIRDILNPESNPSLSLSSTLRTQERTI